MLDCLVIGGGHSGLMCGHLLAQAGLVYRVVDASARAGDVWRMRPKHLRLFTSRWFCRLADLAMEGDPNGFPSGQEFADHVERFAMDKCIAASYNTRVVRLSRAEGGFVAELGNGETVRSVTVINATGSNQVPTVPVFAQQLNAAVVQISAPAFREAAELPLGWSIAVVGDGASGRQIARELATGRRVYLARGRVRKLVPNVVLGRDVFWWLDKIGLLFAGRDSVVAKIMRKRDPIPAASANDTQLLAAGVLLKPRAIDAKGTRIFFSDGSNHAVNAVVWCGGYRENLDWIYLPLIKEPGSLVHGEGRTPEVGFYLVGRKWLTCRASELVLGTERDATKVVGYVTEQIQLAGQSANRKEGLAHA